MRCPSCEFDNPEEMRFCGECGVSLKPRCPQCGFENQPQCKFCGRCATPLELTGQGGQATTDHRKPAGESREARHERRSVDTFAAERRQLTVLFCDLVDSTALATRLDLEELRQVVRAYQAACAGVITRFEGYIAQYLGDGLLVYFGYPQAHEDGAQRAVGAGLGIVAAMAQLNRRLEGEYGVRLAVRLGIHTGPVVVGEMGTGATLAALALGETPNIAARLQELAEPDTVVIGAATHRLVQGSFACQDLGPHLLKEMVTPVHLFRVLGASAARSHLAAAMRARPTPLVGREHEVGMLLERWAQVKAEMGQMVVLSGEAGIGKSRLVQVLKAHLSGESHVRLESRCSPYYQHSPLHPVIVHLHRLLQWQSDDAAPEKLRKLEVVLDQYGFALPAMLPLFAALLSLPLPERYAPLSLTPQRQRQETLEALAVWLLAEAKRQPVLLIVEDLHWIDPSTLELLGRLIDQMPTAPILTLLTCRPEFRPPWAPRAHLTQLTLSRLTAKQVQLMIEPLAGGKALPAEVVRQVVAKTDGVPLFVEELTKMVLESGWLQEQVAHYELAGPLPPLAIPATLQDLLMARLDRLGTAKAVTQLGATLGRTFSYELLRAIARLDERTLQHELARLVTAELLYRHGVPPQETYTFKHALIQEAAYQSLLKSTRQRYHQRIAQVLEARFPEVRDTQPELLAHHYMEAGVTRQAIVYLQQAGQRASQRSAYVEAISHLSKGLELLTTLPNTPERTQQELALHLALGVPLTATKGAGAPEVERAYSRARELCQQGGETSQLFPVLRGLWVFYLVREELEAARGLGEQLLALAWRVQDPALVVEAHRALGTSLFYLAELGPALACFERGMAVYDPEQHGSLAFRFGQDPGVVCQGFAAWALWLLGYPDRALKRSHEALALAQELEHPFSLAYALDFTARIHQARREAPSTYKWAEELTRLAREQGFAQRLATGTILQGWGLAEQGQRAKGMAQMHQGLAAFRATGAELSRPYYLALLVEAYGKDGQTAEGLNAMAEALTAAHRTGERYYEAELYRLKGELLLALSKGNAAEAEACFRQALEISRRQQAKSLELRAAVSLSRLWRRQGKCDEAQQLLAEIYGWFTEGFDTADLQEAKALHKELS